jgi:pimeloyl-ACP methyl ester carboxylesterase
VSASTVADVAGDRAASLAAHFDLVGPDAAPAIVFLHGTRLTRAVWTPQATALSTDFRVVSLDLPGHGTMAHMPFTLAAAADQVAAVIDAAGAGPAIVVGLSLGGYVAMEVGARHPGLVRGLVLADATLDPVGPRAWPYRGLAWAMDRFDGPRLERLNRWYFRTRFGPEVASPIIAGGFWTGAGATALRSLAGQRFSSRLATYGGPVLLLNGQYDLPFRLGVRGFARVSPQAHRMLVGGATHLANLDRPAAFNEAIRRFAASLDASG